MSRLRITEGHSKGKSLKAPAASLVRPTGSKIRQALFNILRDKIHLSSFLDVCAGSGAVGLEALSRGAAELTAIEEDKRVLQTLRKNLDKLGFKAKILQGHCITVLSRLQNHSFDLIFADPPYRTNLADSIADVVAHYELLTDNGWLIIEHSRKHRLPEQLPGIILFDDRHYGQTTLSFFCRNHRLRR